MLVVLVVEDEEQVRVLAESFLQEAGYETLPAGTIDEARALIERPHKIDLLFTDMGLGDDAEGGVKVSKAAREKLDGIPIVYTSGRGLTDGMRALMQEPFEFNLKPYTTDQLVTA